MLAEVGHGVICVDVGGHKVENLKKGTFPIYKLGLTPLVTSNYASKRLIFTSDPKVNVEHGEVTFIALGTPPYEDGSADLKYVPAVAESIDLRMECPTFIVNKSTVPVGTADLVMAHVSQKMCKRSLVVHLWPGLMRKYFVP